MKERVSAVFDIGKTNKKFFLFDRNLQEIYREYKEFDQVHDEDGYPTENIEALKEWVLEVFDTILKDSKYTVETLNFSTYGASLVHIDAHGKVLAPLYNYSKPFDDKLKKSFFSTYGPEIEFTRRTGSIHMGMLNSGQQLYWIKKTKPELFSKISYSLHLPQYLSYLFTGIPYSDYTSIGCHTALWDYDIGDYHQWVYSEGIVHKLAPIVPSSTKVSIKIMGKTIDVGAGIHDSSSSLFSYLKEQLQPFVLLSTGTWSVALNPFIKSKITGKHISEGCLNYMQINGDSVRASSLFLGNEHRLQVDMLSTFFNKPDNYYQDLLFDPELYSIVNQRFKPVFKWVSLPTDTREACGFKNHEFTSFEEAYHHLVRELVIVQCEKLNSITDQGNFSKLYIDGGFSNNDIFISILKKELLGVQIKKKKLASGSAFGAALVLYDKDAHTDPIH